MRKLETIYYVLVIMVVSFVITIMCQAGTICRQKKAIQQLTALVDSSQKRAFDAIREAKTAQAISKQSLQVVALYREALLSK